MSKMKHKKKVKNHIVYSGWAKNMPEALKCVAIDILRPVSKKDTIDDIMVPTWYVIEDIPRSNWDGVMLICRKSQARAIRIFRSSHRTPTRSKVDRYSDWIKSKESIRFITRIRYTKDLSAYKKNNDLLDNLRRLYDYTEFVANNHFPQFSHQQIVDRLFKEFLDELIEEEHDILQEDYVDLISWAYGNQHEIFEDELGSYTYHLIQDEDDDFLDFCKNNLKSAIVENIDTKVAEATFYRIRIQPKDAFTVKMFTI